MFDATTPEALSPTHTVEQKLRNVYLFYLCDS